MTDEKSEQLRLRAHELAAKMTLEEKISQLTNNSQAIPGLGIRQYDWWNEALHGVARAGTATVFPQAIGLAASFNTALLKKVAEAISDEARAKYNDAQKSGNCGRYYGLTFWSPNVNIFRDPRWGRGQETYGEDPYLTSRMGVAFIKGIQGDTAHLKAAACAKHFAAHSGPEGTRQSFNSTVTKKDLCETYLPAFEACVKEGGVEAVMGAYNALNGTPCCCNKELLSDLLRGEWGFRGHVVSDCGAVYNIALYHEFCEDLTHAAAAALKSGCDLNCGRVYENLSDAYEEDLIDENDLDTALERLLLTRLKLGMLGEKTEYDGIGTDVIASPAHKELCLEMARQSLVLLKNGGLLPLDRKSVKTVAVIGPNADSKDVLLGNYNGIPTEYVTVADGISEIIGRENVRYAKGCDFFGGEKDELYYNAVSLAAECDVTVLCLGLDSSFEGEAGDANNPFAAGDRTAIELPAPQEALLRRVCSVSKRVIVVLLSGGAFAVPYAHEHAAAVIQGWYPGELGGRAVAQLVFGDYSPSGKLPVTFYKSTADLPDFSDYSMKNRTYRYFDGEVLYPFGHGLSYTSFSFTEPQISAVSEDEVTVSVTVSNTGSRDSYETVLLYKKERDNLHAPLRSLTRFEKVFIKKGESAAVTFTLGRDDLCRINGDGKKEYPGADAFDLFIM